MAQYSDYFEIVEPLNAVAEPQHFPCDSGTLLHHPWQTKGEDYGLASDAGACCAPEEGACLLTISWWRHVKGA